MKNIETLSNEFIQNDYEIIPCGDAHLKKMSTIGFLKVKRKSICKGKERIICTLENPSYDIEKYVEFFEL